MARATVLAWLAAFAASSSQAALLAGFAASSRAAGSSRRSAPRVWASTSSPAPSVCIVGGGIVGVSIAYQLSLRGVGATIVDRVGLCPAASGKAGGFLALDWNDGSPVAPLARASFEMHERIAADVAPFAAPGAALGYRRLTCEAVAVGGGGGGARPASRKLASVEWADLGVAGSRSMGGEDTIAQVHPRELTHAMFAAAEARAGASLRTGTVEGVDLGEAEGGAPPAVRGVRLEGGEALAADVVVLAMGPWTGAAAKWGLPRVPPFFGQKYHSVLMRPRRVLTQAVFFQGLGDPEVYPRPDGDVYVTGFPDAPAPVTEAPGEVAVRDDVCERLEDAMRAVSTELGEAAAAATTRQACHLPLSADGLPVIGAVPGVARGTCFVAAGHSCWGILNSPATGLAVSELILDGKSASVDLAPFDPRRFA